MIFLFVVLFLQAQGIQAGQNQAPQTPGQTAQPTPKPYSGPHTLAKTWGDLYPGLRTPAKPVHAPGVASKGTANILAATSRTAPPSGRNAVPTRTAANKAAMPGAKPPSTIGAATAPDTRPMTGTAPSITPSSQLTFYNGANKSGDGRVDVMHFRDGKMAVTMGKDWSCSYANDPQQHRVVIICDGERRHPS